METTAFPEDLCNRYFGGVLPQEFFRRAIRASFTGFRINPVRIPDLFSESRRTFEHQTVENCVFSRLKKSRADWIRTSDLYTPSVARYQTTLQPEADSLR